jgi:hypothetical protein
MSDAYLAIAAEILGHELPGKKAKFLNFRHTGASDIAQRGREPRHLLAVVRMMGETSVAAVNRHFFDLEDEVMQEIMEGWAVPDVEVFTPDLQPGPSPTRRTPMSGVAGGGAAARRSALRLRAAPDGGQPSPPSAARG